MFLRRILSFAFVVIELSLFGCRTSAATGQHAILQTQLNDDVPMVRFWRGFAQNRLAYPQFISLINQKLIPQTITVNAGRGLLGYLPFVFPSVKPDYLPDEIAIVAYSSKEAYQTIRSTAEGVAYGDLHFAPGLFAKQSPAGIPSGSTIAEVWNQTAIPSADGVKPPTYIFGNPSSWKKHPFIFRVILTPHGLDRQRLMTMLKDWRDVVSGNSLVQTAVVLIADKYVLEVIGGSDAQALARVADKNDSGIGQVFISKSYMQMPVQGARVGEGTGVSVQF